MLLPQKLGSWQASCQGIAGGKQLNDRRDGRDRENVPGARPVARFSFAATSWSNQRVGKHSTAARPFARTLLAVQCCSAADCCAVVQRRGIVFDLLGAVPPNCAEVRASQGGQALRHLLVCGFSMLRGALPHGALFTARLATQLITCAPHLLLQAMCPTALSSGTEVVRKSKRRLS